MEKVHMIRQGGVMKQRMLVAAFVALVPLVALADSDDRVVARFDSGIGVDPVSGITAATATTPAVPTSNVVRGVAPGGTAWHIGEFQASVSRHGHIFVEGHHLVLAAGDSLGQSLQLSVQAQLYCGAGSTTPITTTSTALDGNGDFRFNETLPSAPPDPCVNPLLLIVTGATPHWLAAGIPQLDLDD
jgi:hypothetical protein